MGKKKTEEFLERESNKGHLGSVGKNLDIDSYIKIMWFHQY